MYTNIQSHLTSTCLFISLGNSFFFANTFFAMLGWFFRSNNIGCTRSKSYLQKQTTIYKMVTTNAKKTFETIFFSSPKEIMQEKRFSARKSCHSVSQPLCSACHLPWDVLGGKSKNISMQKEMRNRTSLKWGIISSVSTMKSHGWGSECGKSHWKLYSV